MTAAAPPTASTAGRLTRGELAAIAAIVVIWGVNNAAAEVATRVLPPLLVGALRFSIAAVCLAWFVRPPFPNRRSLLVLAVLGGPVHFGLVYWGFAVAHDLSPYSVALQLWIPFTALFSWLLLKEPLSKPAMLGLALAFGGVAYMTADPLAFRDWRAMVIGAAATAAWAIVTVIARRTTAVPPLKMQGLISLFAAPTLLIGAFLFEEDPVAAVARATPLVWSTSCGRRWSRP